MNQDNLATEARARILWGESALEVRGFLLSNGLSESEANVWIRRFRVERTREIRKSSIRRILIGAGLMLPGIFALYVIFGKSRIHGSLIASGKGMGFSFVLGMYGLWKLLNGIAGIICPESEHESVSDME